MEVGKYKRRAIDFNLYGAFSFAPSLWRQAYCAAGCGACTLSLLIGTNPYTFSLLNKNKADYTDKFMLRVLKKHGFKVIPITQCAVTNFDTIEYPVSKYNVVLVSQLFRKNEASWAVIHNNIYYHNFEVCKMESLDFLNKPILTAYCLWHPKFAGQD